MQDYRDYPAPLAKVIESYSNLYMPDLMPLFLMLGAVAGSRFEGDPIHFFLVGPPSGGKNELLESLFQMPKTYHITTFNESALLSASGSRDRSSGATGGLLMKVGQGGSGTFIFTEFNSILSMHPDTRKGCLSAIHQVCSGLYDRDRGTDGGMNLSWRGKIQVIAACTQQIEEHMALLAKFGERFLYCRMPKVNRKAQIKVALLNARNGTKATYKRLRAEAVKEFFENLQVPNFPEELLDSYDEETIGAITDFASLARSPVPRNERREIDYTYDGEQPARMIFTLQRLLCGMRAIGVPKEESLRIIARTALSSMPGLRKMILKIIAEAAERGDTVTIAEMRHQLTFYGETTIRRALEDLEIHGIIQKVNHYADYWSFTEEAFENWCIAFEPGDIEA